MNAEKEFYKVVALHCEGVFTLAFKKPNRPEVLGVIVDELSKTESEEKRGKLMEYCHLMHLW